MRLLAVALLLLSAAACGFQMRGEYAFPSVMHSTYIEYRGDDVEILRTVARALAVSGVRVVPAREQANAVLHIVSSGMERRVLLRDLNGRPREYAITMRLRYALKTVEGEALLPVEEVERSDNVTLDPSEPLSMAGDIERAVEILREDAVWDMLGRLAAAGSPAEIDAQ